MVEKHYFPHVIKAVAERVNQTFETRATDAFSVFFEYGLYQDVFRTVHKRQEEGYETYPLIWLMMPFREKEGVETGIQAEVTCDVLITVPTEPGLSMQEREEASFTPRLLPIYDELIRQIGKAGQFFQIASIDKVPRTRQLLPYWGGDESGNANQANLSKQYVDAIKIEGMQLLLKQKTC